jgi:hypothetical protein
LVSGIQKWCEFIETKSCHDATAAFLRAVVIKICSPELILSEFPTRSNLSGAASSSLQNRQ